jgi:hypothetical protein
MPPRPVYKSLLIALLLLSSLIGCEDDGNDCNSFSPSNCLQQEPLNATLTVKVTIDERFSAVPITIYRGYIEDQRVVLQDTLAEDKVFYTLPVNYRYSVSARYDFPNKESIFTLNDAKLSKDSENRCGYRCWDVNHGTANVRYRDNAD